jgi:hypothetical protein
MFKQNLNDNKLIAYNCMPCLHDLAKGSSNEDLEICNLMAFMQNKNGCKVWMERDEASQMTESLERYPRNLV